MVGSIGLVFLATGKQSLLRICTSNEYSLLALSFSRLLFLIYTTYPMPALNCCFRIGTRMGKMERTSPKTERNWHHTESSLLIWLGSGNRIFCTSCDPSRGEEQKMPHQGAKRKAGVLLEGKEKRKQTGHGFLSLHVDQPERVYSS